MKRNTRLYNAVLAGLAVIGLVGALAFTPTIARAAAFTGSVQGVSKPIAGSTVTLFAAGTGTPAQLAQGKTDDKGAFKLTYGNIPADSVLYVIAKGGTPQAAADKKPNDAIALLAVLGGTPPRSVVVNEFSNIASVWTSAQFLKGDVLSGTKLGLRIAAGNVTNLVDLETGGLGPVIQDPLNSSQTMALATFNTLANLLAGCITRVQGDACDKFFAAATPPGGTAPTDTLTAAQNIARNPSNQAQKLFTLLDAFYPVPAGARWRPVPFIPYLNFAPGAWTLSLVYAGGGLNSLGGIAIDGEGNMWADDNFLVGAQSTIYSGFGGPGFGIAISADDKVWATSLAAKNISVFDRKTGKPLSPETGYSFGGQLGTMQGIITTPNGDVWALDNGKSQIVYLPKGDATKGRILGRTVNGKPVDGTLQVKMPFHLAVDQQDRIWVTNSGSNTVTRFPASDPGKAEEITVGFAPRAVAIDSLGNAWVANTVGHPDTKEKLALVETKLKSWVEGLVEDSASKADADAKMWIDLFELLVKYPGGDVSLVRPDGTVLPPFDAGKSINGPWGIAIDGNDNVWVANAMGHSVTQLCGARPENCPPGAKTGDPISPQGGHFDGLQIITDVAIDPAGNVWVANNWDRPDEGFKKVPQPALSTRFGGNGTVVFFGLAKPVKTPLVGPMRTP
jgi:streptogramin lyase